MTNIAQTINVLQCLIETRGPDAWLTPTYHVYRFYREHVGHDSLTTHVDSADLGVQNGTGRPVSQLSASTSLSEDGSRVSFAVTNRHYSESVDCTLRLPERILGDVTARLLAGDEAMSANSASSPDAVAPTDLTVRSTNGALTIQLPPHSIAMLTASVT